MNGRSTRVAGVIGVFSAALMASLAQGGPTSGPASRPDAAEDYSVIAAGHIGRLRTRLAVIDDALGASEREEHDRLLIEKMAVLFELLTLEGRQLDPLEKLATEARSHEPGEGLAAAADYWRLRVGLTRVDRVTKSQPAAGAALKQVEQYLDAHPQSPYAALLIAEVIEAAYSQRDFDAVDRLLGRLKRDLPEHPSTTALLGGDRLRRAVGEVFAPAMTDVRGAAVDWVSLRGRPILVLYWASWDVASQRVLRQIAAWPGMGGAERASLVTISLDRAAADAEAALAKAGLHATVCCDGKGWQSAAAEAWGIRSLPVALVLDDGGRLRSVVSGVGSDYEKRLGAAWRAAGGRLE